VVRSFEGGEDLTPQGVGQGIALGGPVEGQAPDMGRGIIGEQDGFVGHGGVLSGFSQPRDKTAALAKAAG